MQCDPCPQILCCSVRRSNCEVLSFFRKKTKEYFAFLQEPLAASRCDPEESLLRFPLTMNCTVLEDQAIGQLAVVVSISLSSLYLLSFSLSLKSKCSHSKRPNDAQNRIVQGFFIWISSLCTRNNCQAYDVLVVTMGVVLRVLGRTFVFFTPCPCLLNVNLNLEAASVATFSLMN